MRQWLEILIAAAALALCPASAISQTTPAKPAAPAAPRANPFAPESRAQKAPPSEIVAETRDPAGSSYGLSYVGRVGTKDVFLFKDGKCYVEAENGRYSNSGCYRAYQFFLRDHPNSK